MRGSPKGKAKEDNRWVWTVTNGIRACDVPHWLGGEQITLYKGVKAQREQYLLAVDLGRYEWYQSQSPDGVPVRTLGPKGGWVWGRSHIDWIKERVPARTVGPEEGWIVMSHIGWGGEQITLYKGVETFP